ncbi:MAG: endonuclease/exonuclease/phosphatase family protein [Chloroflexota bacterium]|nr:endonuclease/exonuclease/phosphatase family protein [Chloroflexota bacterium]
MSEVLRVMSFNIRGFYHPGDGVNQWHHREALNLATIRRCAPHLIGMQEVQGGNLSAYRRLLTEYHFQAWPEYGNAPPYEWPAIFWDPRRLQPLDSGGFWLSETPGRHSASWGTDCIRSAAWIAFRCVNSGASVIHANTHLDHVSERARLEGSRLILRHLERLQSNRDIAIVTGDFNTTPGSPVHRLWLDDGFVDAHLAADNDDDDPTVAYTNHGWDGAQFTRNDDTPRRIDWILIREGPRISASVASCEIVRHAAPPVYPSDHYPVVAEVAIGLAR